MKYPCGLIGRYLTTTLLLLGLSPVGTALAHQPSLCRAGENVVFSCMTTNRKVVSVCTSSNLKEKPTQGYIAYRFGTQKKLELQLLSHDPGNQDSPLYYHYFRPQADRNQLWFNGGGATYTVFTNYDGTDSPSSVAGVMVDLGDKRSVSILCKRGFDANWWNIEGVVACSDEVLNSCNTP